MSLNNRRPCPNCPLECRFHGNAMCVSNLISLGGQNAPISLGLHIGLSHTYDGPMPPCVRGPLGSAYWSTAPEGNPADQLQIESPEPLMMA